MIRKTHSVEYTIYSDISEVPNKWHDLIRKSKEASDLAHAPYSNFNVGSSILLDNGKIVLGANQENAAYPLCTCAEQICIYNAAIQYPGIQPSALGLYVNVKNQGDIPPSPCGACRQVILETEEKFGIDITILITSQNPEVFHFPSIKSLLPFYFSGKDLS